MSSKTPEVASWGAPRASVSSLPPCKRYIITHNEAGKSVVHSAPAHLYRGRADRGGTARSYATTGFPISVKDDEDIDAYMSDTGVTSHLGTEIVNPNGLNVNVIELAPQAASQFHRTPSMDIVTVTSGTLQLHLDSGESITLHPGDHVIQRGTMHKWVNPSATEPTRYVAVIVPIAEFDVADGKGGRKVIREEHVRGSQKEGFDLAKL